MKLLSTLSIFLIVLLALGGCGSKRDKSDETRLPRAQPAFMQWMTRQSLQTQSREMIAEVSQSGRMWLNNSAGHSPSVLLKAAPVWLEVNPRTSASKLPLFRILATETDNIARFGFTGIFLGPTGERPEIWVGQETGRGGAGMDAFGRNTASLKFDPAAGSEEDFERLASRAEAVRLQLGSDLVGASTGIGPDFLLACRKAAGYGGLYAMLPAPEDVWSQLPEASGEWEFQALNQQTVESLVAKGVLPGGVGRDNISWASDSGWGVTGPVIGTDGNARRWLYRYSGTPQNPVMLWQDPSSAARQTFSGAVIASTGLNRESLVGIRLEPMVGLEASGKGEGSHGGLAPMLGALNDIASEIHRYGGWALQADALPVEAMETVLAGPCDFCRDAVTPAFVAQALMDGNGTPLANLYNGWISKNIDQKRLARGFNDVEGIHWNVISGLVPGGLPRNFDEVYARVGQTGTGSPGSFYDLIFAWRLGLPGFAFISASEMEKLGENFTSSILRNAARDKQDAYNTKLRKLLEARRNADLANGQVVTAYGTPNGACGILSTLPAGGYWLMACNFGDKRADVQINLPQRARSAMDAATGTNIASLAQGGARVRLPLEPRQARHVILQAGAMKGAAAPAQPVASPAETLPVTPPTAPVVPAEHPDPEAETLEPEPTPYTAPPAIAPLSPARTPAPVTPAPAAVKKPVAKPATPPMPAIPPAKKVSPPAGKSTVLPHGEGEAGLSDSTATPASQSKPQPEKAANEPAGSPPPSPASAPQIPGQDARAVEVNTESGTMLPTPRTTVTAPQKQGQGTLKGAGAKPKAKSAKKVTVPKASQTVPPGEAFLPAGKAPEEVSPPVVKKKKSTKLRQGPAKPKGLNKGTAPAGTAPRQTPDSNAKQVVPTTDNI